MPELPEVQTIISDLNKKIIGDTITDFWSEWPKAIKGKSLAVFKKEIIGRKILGARRMGKNIFIDLSGGKTLYIHLKMTGHLLVKTPQEVRPLSTKATKRGRTSKRNYFSDKVNQYIHHIWYLKSKNKKFVDSDTFADSNRTLEFSDLRKFAKIVLDDAQKINELKEIKALGVDAMSPEFTLKKFEEILGRRKNKAIGLVLMEQELIAGIGNIYRSEILFEAGILPTKPVKNINKEGIKKLYVAIKEVLEKAIKLRGTSDSDYRDTAGAPGSFQKVAKVYRREREKCQKCDTIIMRKKIGQRSTFFCPICQK